ncbi:MAG TPA: transcriptional repressor LexA [Candidatus Dormibacteraeota bacterium]|jgi:repressor LexA|nr:transcriptional repressor LexA [Candidatus Dormibacteraeota bacterium]
MVEGLNPRQREILEFLRNHARNHAYPPTVREIGQAVGLSSSSTVQNHLNALEQKGHIRRDPTKSRTVEVVGEEPVAAAQSRSFSVPLVGRVAAGGPILAEENIEDHIVLGPEIAGGDDAFALHVRGDSMIEAGIHDGDMVVVRPQRDASSGQIVVARIENDQTGEHEVTVKRFFKEPGRIRLQPENSALQPIYVRDVHLEGVVVAVVRVLR